MKSKNISGALSKNSRYIFDPSLEIELRRQQALCQVFDKGTFSHLSSLNIAPGWRCAEIGAGTGSVAVWLARLVGPSGYVVAVDLDTRYLTDVADEGNLIVREGDIASGGSDLLEENIYDLVHARMLLRWLSPDERKTALTTMITALRPGGLLVVEDVDSGLSGICDPESNAISEVCKAAREFILDRGGDLHYGLKLFGEFCAQGLTAVSAESGVALGKANTPVAEALFLGLAQQGEKLVEENRVDREILRQALDELSNTSSSRVFLSFLMVSVVGRKVREIIK